MHILLTGHTGFLGQAVDEKLKAVDTLEISRLTASDFEDFNHKVSRLSSRMSRVDMILHIGAVSNPQEQTTRLWQMNVAATNRLAEVFLSEQTRVLFLSSYSVYNPDTDYGYSKKCAERILKSYVAWQNLCILRPVSIIGGNQSHKETPSIVDKLKNGDLEYLFSNWYRDFIHLDDVVGFIVKQVIADWDAGTFDLGTGEAMPCSELADYHDLLGIAAEDVPPIREHARPSRRVANPDRFPPGWQPSFRLGEAFEKAFRK